MRGRRLALIVAIGAIAAAAVVFVPNAFFDDEEPEPVPTARTRPASPSPTPSPAPGALPAGWKRCTSAPGAYSIGYPPAWFADDACRFFDPDRSEIREETEQLDTALEVVPATETFDQVVASMTDPDSWRVVSRTDTQISGRRAVTLELEATGEGFPEAQTKVFAYVLDREGRGLVVKTSAPPRRGSRYAEFVEVVKLAVGSLRFTEEGTGAGTGTPDAALRCFFEGRVKRDLESARPCMTQRFAATFDEPLDFQGPSSPNIQRFTIIRDVERDAQRLRVLARAYEGASTGLTSYTDDTLIVVRQGDRWAVDGWTRGSEVTVPEETTVDVYLAPKEIERCADVPEPGGLRTAERDVRVGDDLPLLAIQELLMGPQNESYETENESDFRAVFPVESRVLSVRIAGGVASVDLNEAAAGGAEPCPFQIRSRSINRTLKRFPGVREVRITVEGDPAPS